jgi:hypothetical protein
VKKLFLLFVSIVILAIPWTGQARDHSKEDQVKQWTQTMAQQDSRFTSFTQATIEIKPINKQNELILFKSPEKVIGYMVVEDHDQQLSLLEYGLGPHPLFDQKVVYPYLQGVSAPLQTVYAGLESAWISAHGLYDGKSGEKYPQASTLDEMQSEAAIVSTSSLTMSFQSNSNDPFSKAWFKGGVQLESKSDLLGGIAKNDVMYVAKLYHQTVTAPYSVLGYHLWNKKELFIELADDGSRFVPYSQLASFGHFLR